MSVLQGIDREINELNQHPKIQREMMKMFEKVPKINDAVLNEKKWTDKDLSEFAEWLGINSWKWAMPICQWERITFGKSEFKTTSQLIEMWKKEKEEQK